MTREAFSAAVTINFIKLSNLATLNASGAVYIKIAISAGATRRLSRSCAVFAACIAGCACSFGFVKKSPFGTTPLRAGSLRFY